MKTEQRTEIRGRVVTGETEEETGLLTSFQMGRIRAYLYAAGNDPREQECQDAGGQQPAGEQRQDHRCELWLALVRSTNIGTGGKMDCMGIDAGELPDMLGAHEYFLDDSFFQ